MGISTGESMRIVCCDICKSEKKLTEATRTIGKVDRSGKPIHMLDACEAHKDYLTGLTIKDAQDKADTLLHKSPLKNFRVKGWIHPKQGGDDYPFEYTIRATSEEIVKEDAKKYVKRRSSMVEDFLVEEVAA